MKFVIALALFLGVASAKLIPHHIEVPVWKMNPRLTLGEWQEILAAQVPQPEFVPNYKKGTEMPDPTAGKSYSNGRIVGGSPATTGQFPWMVAITLDNAYICGGSVISSTRVLTAAHCVSGFISFTLVFGSLTFSGGGAGTSTQTSRDATFNAAYNPNTVHNDVAVIRLGTPLSFSTRIGAVRLPTRSQTGNSYVGSQLWVSGWGYTNGGGGISNTLMFTRLFGISNADCAAHFGSVVIASTLCCLGTNGQTVCNGDSGGPLTDLESDGLYTQVGIVSFGGCTLGYPVGFARVTSFLDWIETNSGVTIWP